MRGLATSILLFVTTICSYGQINDKDLGRQFAETELKKALSPNPGHNNIDHKTKKILDNETAILVAEPILFSIYGKDKIIAQKPYSIYSIDNYWVISGTIPKSTKGGVFLFIMDARDCKIIKITHGK